MITRIPAARQTPDWQQQLADAVCDPAELIALLGLDPALLPAARQAAQQFPLRVPRSFVARMTHGEPDDPLLRQVLPLADELRAVPGYGPDPVGDLGAMAAPGVLHKYRGRVLAIATGACAIHCRYCFRRAFPYADSHAAAAQWQALLNYVRARTEVQELILSGGDPLSLNDRRLRQVFEGAASVPHLRRLRLHTRLPVVIPARITEALVAMLRDSPLQCVLVLHCNHPQELDDTLAHALRRLRDADVTLLNQAVLLRGINDRAETLHALSETLFAAGVMPYYLHLLDPVQGAAHFDVDETSAVALVQQLNATLPGYLVPRLVREIVGADGKTPIGLAANSHADVLPDMP